MEQQLAQLEASKAAAVSSRALLGTISGNRNSIYRLERDDPLRPQLSNAAKLSNRLATALPRAQFSASISKTAPTTVVLPIAPAENR